jgi:membrane protein DedA with SNARE-associated domain
MESYIEHFGYLAVLVGTFLEGETVLILAGFAAHRGYLSLPMVIGAAFAGTVFGDQLFYYLGRKHSSFILSRKLGWQNRLDKARRLLHKHKILTILGFRFIYGLRTVTPFALGIADIPPRLFVPLNILGAIVWSVAIGCAGFYFGHALEALFGHLKQIEIWVMVGIVLLGGIIWSFHYYRSR